MSFSVKTQELTLFPKIGPVWVLVCLHWCAKLNGPPFTYSAHQLHTRQLSPTFNDIAWTDQLDHAIQRNDLADMWQLVQRHVDRDEGNRQLVDRIPRLTHRIKHRSYFSEFFLMPVLIPGGSDAFENATDWDQAFACVDEALLAWLPPQTYAMIFHGLRSYDHLGTWQPAIIRQHLLRATGSHGVNEIRYTMEHIQLPPTAPRLGFVTMVLTSKLGWPVLPAARPLQDQRLRHMLTFALHNTTDPEVPHPIVLIPDRLQHAVAHGLALWLAQLHLACPILAWSASPHVTSADVMLITLRLDSAPPWSQFAIRKHHIGMDGLQKVLLQLQALAPNLERPMDA